MPSGSENGSPLTKPLSAIAVPGMYLFYKYSEFMRQQQESHRKKVTEKELDHLNHKIVSGLSLVMRLHIFDDILYIFSC